MKEQLSRKLLHYIQENNPDLFIILQEEKREQEYIKNSIASIDDLLNRLIDEEKPVYIIEETCFAQLTQSLRPSKYNYIRSLTEEKFPKQYEALERSGILITELVNILAVCLPLFEVFHFSEEREDDEHLSYVITAAIKEYFKQSEKETARQWHTIYTGN